MRRAIAITVSMVMVILQSCAPAVMGLSTEGTVLRSEKDRVYVLFEEAMGESGHYTGGWFYFPGLGLINDREYVVQVTLVHIDSGKKFNTSQTQKTCKTQ